MKLKPRFAFALVCSFFSLLHAQSPVPKQASDVQEQSRVHLIENKGQVFNIRDNSPNPDVRFMLERSGGKVFLMKTGITTQFEILHYPQGYAELMQETSHDPEAYQKRGSLMDNIRLETWRVDMELMGANPNASITTDGKSDDYMHFYNRDILFVYHYQKVTYHDIYPGIDWVIHTQGEGIKYDFVVHPGADPGMIRLKYRHQDALELDAAGNLHIRTGMGAFSEMQPVSLQAGREIPTAFVLQGDELRFSVEAYDREQTLVIDPLVRIWGTYYGGDQQEAGTDVDADQYGNLYLTGNTQSSQGIAWGGHQNTLALSSGVSTDAFLVKFNSAGARIWATYYGGNGQEYLNHAAVDDSGNVFLAGTTNSTNGIYFNGHQNLTSNGEYAFLVKFDSAGVRKWGTYYGIGAHDSGKDVTTDTAGNVYLVGETFCPSTCSGVISYNGFQNNFGGGSYDGFLVKFNRNGLRQWGTYYGGETTDGLSDVITDGGNLVFVCGSTASKTGIASSGAYQSTIGDPVSIYKPDGFLACFHSNGNRLWATYYGGIENDYLEHLSYQSGIYALGVTNSTNAIASPGAFQTTLAGNNDILIAKFNANGTRDWGTYLGGTNNDIAYDITTNTTGSVYVTGSTDSATGFATAGYQNTIAGGFDAFLIKFDPSGSRQWGTFYGGSQGDFGRAVDVIGTQGIFLAGYTFSSNGIAFGGFQDTITTNPAPSLTNDAFLVRFSECSHTSAVLQTSSCQPSYTSPSGNHTWTSSGTYADTIPNAAGCDSVLTISLTLTPINTTVTLNSSTLTAQAAGLSYQWLDCGNAMAPVNGATGQSFTPTLSGTYAVALTQNGCTDTSACTAVTVVSRPESGLAAQLRAYPNPTTGTLSLELPHPCQSLHITVQNALGQVVQQHAFTSTRHVDFPLSAPAGLYFLHVAADGETAVVKVIRE